MITTRQGVVLVLVSTVLCGTAAAADWPQWQGPNRNGISPETGLMQEWPAKGPKLLWEQKGLGGGYSTPSVAAGHVYGMGYLGENEIVWALDETTGKVLWKTPTGSATLGIGYPEGPRSTPTVDGDRIYVLGPGGRLSCLKSDTGAIVWKKELEKDFGGRMMSGWGYSESVLVDGDKVVCTPGGPNGTLLALNKKSGEPIWQSKQITDNAAYSSIVPVKIEGVSQYVQLTDQSVLGVSPDDGKLLWRASRRGHTAVIPTPVVHGEYVYVTSGYGAGCNLFKVSRSGDRFSVAEVYSNKVMGNHHGGVVLVEGNIFGFSDGKGWVCQDFKSGSPLWEERSKLGKGSISYADHRLYLRAEGGHGTVVLLVPSATGYEQKGRFDQPDRSGQNSWPHPVIANGKLLLRDQDIVLAYDIRRSSGPHASR